MRLFKSALFLFVFFIIFPSLVFAANIGGGNQQPTPEPNPCANPLITETSVEGADFSTVPAMECIDETVQEVRLTFHNLTEGTEYRVCPGGDFCLKDQAVPLVIGLNNIVTDEEFTADSNGDVSITFCGKNKNTIKLDCDDEDYFHGGNLYAFSIGVVDDDRYLLSKRALIFIERSYPKGIIIPDTGITTATVMKVTLENTSPRPGGENRNNYQVKIKAGELYDEDVCLTLNDRIETAIFNKTIPVGKFTIAVSERVNEGGVRQDHCQGGFTYYEATCEATNVNDGGGTCTELEANKDPKGEEYKAFLKDLASLNKTGISLSFPCGDGTSLEPLGKCPSIKSAIGDIEVIPERFVGSVFQFVLMIATFGAIILIIYSGYLFMMSRGDKEKIAGARETITSAIVGLLFIILSIVILEIIGVDILRIPGFKR